MCTKTIPNSSCFKFNFIVKGKDPKILERTDKREVVEKESIERIRTNTNCIGKKTRVNDMQW